MASQVHQNGKDQESPLDKTLQNYNDLLLTLPKADGWGIEDLYQYQGFWLPSFPALKATIFMQDHFNSKPEDIILASYPKCGTHWFTALIFAIMNRKTCTNYESHPLLTLSHRDVLTILEMKCLQKESIESLEALPNPRCFSVHLPYTVLPQSVKASGCRIVSVFRNPKDVLISQWLFMNKMRSKEQPPLSLEDAFDGFCKGVSVYGPFWDHLLGYRKASQESPEKVLFLTYEQTKKEPVMEVKKLANFLGVPFSVEEESEGVVEKIVKLCSFENMSNLEVNKKREKTGAGNLTNADFFRKGEVGDFVNHLTPEMVARLDEITQEKLAGSGFCF